MLVAFLDLVECCFRRQEPTAYQIPAPTRLVQVIGFTKNRCVDSQGIDREHRRNDRKMARNRDFRRVAVKRHFPETAPAAPLGAHLKRREEFCGWWTTKGSSLQQTDER